MANPPQTRQFNRESGYGRRIAITADIVNGLFVQQLVRTAGPQPASRSAPARHPQIDERCAHVATASRNPDRRKWRIDLNPAAGSNARQRRVDHVVVMAAMFGVVMVGVSAGAAMNLHDRAVRAGVDAMRCHWRRPCVRRGGQS